MSERSSKMSRSELWLSVLALASVFLVGALCGVLLDRTLFDKPRRHLPPFGPGGPHMMLADPFTQVGVSDEQRTRIEEIFARHHAELDGLAREQEPRMRAVAERIDAEIDAILDATQREKLKEIRQQPFEMHLPPPPGGGLRPDIVLPAPPPFGRP